MRKYAKIRVPAQIKAQLQKGKGNQTWGNYLKELNTEHRLLKSKKAFQELTSLLTEDDVKAMAESSKKFRENFTLSRAS
jgi:hypothetical protein